MQWIDAKKEWPPEGLRVILLLTIGHICIGYRENNDQFYEEHVLDRYEITHWMYLPARPYANQYITNDNWVTLMAKNDLLDQCTKENGTNELL